MMFKNCVVAHRTPLGICIEVFATFMFEYTRPMSISSPPFTLDIK